MVCDVKENLKSVDNFFLNDLFLNFIVHQKKGGIHDNNRYDMGTSGNFLVRRITR